jgi:hypothetical protein
MIALLVLGLQLAVAQDTARDAHANGHAVPRVRAIRTSRAPVIDGKLDDEVWRQAPVTTGFMQNRPNAGAALCTPRAGSYCYAYDPDGPNGADPVFAFGTLDRTVRSFRGSAVLRWEYRPGATFYAVWTQQREQTVRVPLFSGASELPGLFEIEPQNVFLIKASYWLSR